MRLYSVFLCLSFLAITLHAQELSCVVTVNTDNIPSSQRNYLTNFKSDIERYLNTTRFTTEDVENRINCSFDVFFKSSTGSNQYTAQVYITSTRPLYAGDYRTDKSTQVLRILDEGWDFTYVQNQRVILDELTTDPFTDFLTYYAYMIIGFDKETYVPTSGNKYFQKAFDICRREGNTANGTNWKQLSTSYNRFDFVDDISSARFDAFHAAFNIYYFDGLDRLATDQQQGLTTILQSLQTIASLRRDNPLSVLLKQFFDAKYKEIADIFLAFPNRGVYEQLSQLDPEHRTAYQDAKNKP